MDTNEIKRRMNSGEIYYENAEIEENTWKNYLVKSGQIPILNNRFTRIGGKIHF
ncbi:hypothetical protein TEHD23766T_1672 [Tetragenococcus halophilus subsp. flandriensis]|nr:hypothetical protein TEHD23766T_1672 [Tetragenococcus halophilus subsp. flandriensis]